MGVRMSDGLRGKAALASLLQHRSGALRRPHLTTWGHARMLGMSSAACRTADPPQAPAQA